MHQPVQSAKVNEQAEVGDLAQPSGADLPRLQLLQ